MIKLTTILQEIQVIGGNIPVKMPDGIYKIQIGAKETEVEFKDNKLALTFFDGSTKIWDWDMLRTQLVLLQKRDKIRIVIKRIRDLKEIQSIGPKIPLLKSYNNKPHSPDNYSTIVGDKTYYWWVSNRDNSLRSKYINQFFEIMEFLDKRKIPYEDNGDSVSIHNYKRYFIIK